MSTAALSLSAADGRALDPAREVKMVLAGMSVARHAYQPIVDLHVGTVVGYEALARFGSGQRSPQAFFAAADQLGRRPDLEAHLLERALGAAAGLPAGCFLAVNVGPDLLASDPVWSVLRRHGALEGIVLELTEHSPVDNLIALRRRVDQLREQGALLALDDVGAGWSGLAQMTALRPDIVKLDKSIIRGLADDEVKLALVELMAGFADRIGSRLLAEGVEQPQELQALSRLGMGLGQGWLLGRPQFRPAGLACGAVEMLAAVRQAQPRTGPATVGLVQDRTVAQVTHPAALGFLPMGLPAHAVLVDAARRPTGLWVTNGHPGAPSGWAHEATCIPTSTRLDAALTVALARPGLTRNDPLVVVGADGRATGVLALAVLLLELGVHLSRR